MPGIQKLLILTLGIHICLVLATIYLTNLGETPYYGGSAGFLPSTGDSAHPYDRFSAWLAGGGDQLNDPGDQGGIAILQWIVRKPLCMSVSFVRWLIILTTFSYEVIQLIPTGGFGGWFKILIHLVGVFLTGLLAQAGVRFAIQAGVFSNIYMMGMVLGISTVGIVSTALNAGGVFSCG